MRPDLCSECRAPIPLARGNAALTCSKKCAHRRKRKRALAVPPRERTCSRTGCLRLTSKDAPICHVHLPVFHVEPKPRPRRANYFELVHATYGGQSIAAQVAESRSGAQEYQRRKAARG